MDDIRQNEGEAAEYGIFFDDTEYDYMQHLRTVGEQPDAVLLEASGQKDKGKGTSKEVVFGKKVCVPSELRVMGSWDCRRRCSLQRKKVSIGLNPCRMSPIV